MGKVTADEVAQAIANGDVRVDEVVAALRPSLLAKGLAVVPLKPTQRMIQCGHDLEVSWPELVWEGMVAQSPA